MATVTMDLNEVDKMRDDLKTSKLEIEQLKEEKTKILGDKRVIKVVQKVFVEPDNFVVEEAINRTVENNYTVFMESLKQAHAQRTADRMGSGRSSAYMRSMSDDGRRYYDGVRYFNPSMAKEVANRIYQSQHLKGTISEKSSDKDMMDKVFNVNYAGVDKQFINFDDVKAELREEVENKVRFDIESAKQAADEAEMKLTNALNSQERELLAIKSKHNQEITNLHNDYNKAESNYTKRIEELQEEVVALREGNEYKNEMEKLQDRIQELEAELKKKGEKRGFFTSWFN